MTCIAVSWSPVVAKILLKNGERLGSAYTQAEITRNMFRRLRTSHSSRVSSIRLDSGGARVKRFQFKVQPVLKLCSEVE